MQWSVRMRLVTEDGPQGIHEELERIVHVLQVGGQPEGDLEFKEFPFEEREVRNSQVGHGLPDGPPAGLLRPLGRVADPDVPIDRPDARAGLNQWRTFDSNDNQRMLDAHGEGLDAHDGGIG
jgi:hypothetical protein